jgi:SET domain-containing protein
MPLWVGKARIPKGLLVLLIHTYIDKSAIQGIGVFAKHAIARGEVIWRLDQRFDRLIEVDLYESMEGPVKSYLDRYCYPRRSDPRYIVFEADDARYMNHSDRPNCDFGHGDVAYALTDIAAGDELTCNYNVFFEEGFEFLGDR